MTNKIALLDPGAMLIELSFLQTPLDRTSIGTWLFTANHTNQAANIPMKAFCRLRMHLTDCYPGAIDDIICSWMHALLHKVNRGGTVILAGDFQVMLCSSMDYNFIPLSTDLLVILLKLFSPLSCKDVFGVVT